MEPVLPKKPYKQCIQACTKRNYDCKHVHFHALGMLAKNGYDLIPARHVNIGVGQRIHGRQGFHIRHHPPP